MDASLSIHPRDNTLSHLAGAIPLRVTMQAAFKLFQWMSRTFMKALHSPGSLWPAKNDDEAEAVHSADTKEDHVSRPDSSTREYEKTIVVEWGSLLKSSSPETDRQFFNMSLLVPITGTVPVCVNCLPEQACRGMDWMTAPHEYAVRQLADPAYLHCCWPDDVCVFLQSPIASQPVTSSPG